MNHDQFRRKAIKKVSLGLGGLLLTPANLFANENPTVKKLGVALVGLGNYSTKQLAPALQETELCYLAGIVTGTPEKASIWANKYNISPKNIYDYQNFDDIKDNPAIDIIYVVLPNFLHAEYTIRAAKAGKHVICEKPLAMDVAECKKMLAACKKAHVKFGVGYRLYHEPHHLEVRRLGTDKVFGDIKLIESSLGFTRPPKDSWRLDKKKGGGAIMDLGIYAIQGARRTIDENPISVTAQAFNFDKEHFQGIHETVLWQFEFPNGTVANCSTTYSAYVDRLYITCKKGWFGLGPAYNAIGTKGNTIQGDMSFKSKSYQQIDQLDDFAYAVLNDKKPKATGEEGLEDIMLIEKILQAAKTGEKIRITRY